MPSERIIKALALVATIADHDGMIQFPRHDNDLAAAVKQFEILHESGETCHHERVVDHIEEAHGWPKRLAQDLGLVWRSVKVLYPPK